MIFFNKSEVDGEVAALIARFDVMPKFLARKYLVAALRAAMKTSNGVQVLKANTPVGGGRRVKAAVVRGQLKENYKRRGGSLRRAVAVKAKWAGTNKAGRAIAVLGYKYGFDSRKAIWLENGTKRGIAPRKMAEKSMNAIKPIAAKKLAGELASAFEACGRELPRYLANKRRA